MLLLDTSALLFWSLDPGKLSEKAQKHIKETENLIISSISIWEIGIKIKRKKLITPLMLNEFVTRLKKTGQVEIIPVDETIWIKNIELEWDNGDPADRTIVATALIHDCSLVTSDKIITQFYSKTIW
ncbi:Ribonuclease VapC22 [subsurface metagenome]